MVKRNLFILPILLILLLSITGCFEGKLSPSENSPKMIRQNDESKTPDLLGGPESNSRMLDNRTKSLYIMSLSTIYYCGSPNKKEVALTFDDGPDLKYTPQILDVLKKYNVKATFFVIGKRAQRYPGMVKRIKKEGHVIGNHTWDHPKLSELNSKQIEDEINKTNQELNSLIGYYPILFRSPYGILDKGISAKVNSMGYKIIAWSIDTRDWAGTPVLEIMNYVKKDLRPGGIILEHCAGGEEEDLSNTVKALPQIIETLKSQGYSFVTIPVLLSLK